MVWKLLVSALLGLGCAVLVAVPFTGRARLVDARRPGAGQGPRLYPPLAGDAAPEPGGDEPPAPDAPAAGDDVTRFEEVRMEPTRPSAGSAPSVQGGGRPPRATPGEGRSGAGRGVLEGAFSLLEALAGVDEAGLSDLAVRAGLPKATAHRLLGPRT